MGNTKTLISFGFVIIFSIAYTYIVYFKKEETLPIYQPSDINPALVDSNLIYEKDHRILDFTLVNHLGDKKNKFNVLYGQINENMVNYKYIRSLIY